MDSICIREQICIYANLHMCANVLFILHSHGFMEARVFLSKIGNCSLNNKYFTDFLKITERLIKLVQLMYMARAVVMTGTL